MAKKRGFKAWLSDQWFYLRARLKMVSREELADRLGIHSGREEFLREIPDEEAREELSAVFQSLDDLKTVTDMSSYLSLTRKVGAQMEMISQKYGDVLGESTKYKLNYIGGVDSVGWRPSGARIFQGFINPFQVFSFFAENHWSTKAALETIITEVRDDGYSLEYDDENVSPERIAEVESIFEQVGLRQLRLDCLKHYLVYGNGLVLPHRNRLGGNVKLELLIMDRVWPVLDRFSEKILGWDYWEGFVAHFYPKEQVYHLSNPSLKNPDIGVPPLACLVGEIESDMAATSLNGAVFHTAGAVGAILVMEDDPARTSGKDMEKFSRRLQKEIQLQFTGSEGTHGLLVTNYVKAVHRLSQLGDLEANHTKWREIVAKSICTVLKVPPEKLSISRSQGLQYQAALVEDQINKAFDKAISAYMMLIDAFINLIIREVLGITDVQIVANGRFGSMTLNGARMSKTAAETGLPLTFNDHLELFYGLPRRPKSDPVGDMYIDTSPTRDPNKLPPQFRGDTPGQYPPGVREQYLKPAASAPKKPGKKKRKQSKPQEEDGNG
jgi:hypothetical protein